MVSCLRLGPEKEPEMTQKSAFCSTILSIVQQILLNSRQYCSTILILLNKNCSTNIVQQMNKLNQFVEQFVEQFSVYSGIVQQFSCLEQICSTNCSANDRFCSTKTTNDSFFVICSTHKQILHFVEHVSLILLFVQQINNYEINIFLFILLIQ